MWRWPVMLELIMMGRNVMMTMMTMRMTMMCNGNVKSRKIVICAISFNSFIQIRGNCQKIYILELLCSSKYCDGTHCPCPQHSPRANIMHKQCIKNLMVGVGNPDNWLTQDSPPQDCPLVGNPEVGNPDYNLLKSFWRVIWVGFWNYLFCTFIYCIWGYLL